MTVTGLADMRREEKVQIAFDIMPQFIDRACRTKRNYILDQANVSESSRMKMRQFEGFHRKAVVIVPTHDNYKQRCYKRYSEEGRDIPDPVLFKMKASYTFPEQGSLFEEVEFLELSGEEADKQITNYKIEARKRMAEFAGPGMKKFRPQGPGPMMRFGGHRPGFQGNNSMGGGFGSRQNNQNSQRDNWNSSKSNSQQNNNSRGSSHNQTNNKSGQNHHQRQQNQSSQQNRSTAKKHVSTICQAHERLRSRLPGPNCSDPSFCAADSSASAAIGAAAVNGGAISAAAAGPAVSAAVCPAASSSSSGGGGGSAAEAAGHSYHRRRAKRSNCLSGKRSGGSGSSSPSSGAGGGESAAGLRVRGSAGRPTTSSARTGRGLLPAVGAVLLPAGERAGGPASSGGPAAAGGRGAAAASGPAAAGRGGAERSVLPVLRLVPAGGRLLAAQKVDFSSSCGGFSRANTETALLEFLNKKVFR